MANKSKTAQSRRDAVRAKQNEAKVQAQLDEQVKKPAPEEAARIRENIAKQAVVPRRERNAAEQRRAKAQAEVDATLKPKTVDEVVGSDDQFAQRLQTGRPLSLYEQNARRKQLDRAVRNEAREIANEVGKSTYNTLIDRAPKSRHSRLAKMRKALGAATTADDDRNRGRE